MPLPIILGAAAAAMGIAKGVGALVGAAKDRKESKKIKPVYKPYEVSPYAKNTLGLAKQMLGAKSAAVTQAEANINQNFANQMGAAEQGATDSSQLLAMGAAGQAQSNQAALQLTPMQQQFQLQQQQNVMQANQGMTAELDKVYQDAMQKYMIDQQLKMGYRNSARKGFDSGMSALSSTLASAAVGGYGDLGKLFKGPGNAASTNDMAGFMRGIRAGNDASESLKGIFG